MSVTPTEPGHYTWTAKSFPKIFREKAVRAMAGIYGDSAGAAEIGSYRMCWYCDHAFTPFSPLINSCRDTSTPQHDFLICPHPHSERLYIATGGSFHGWNGMSRDRSRIIWQIRRIKLLATWKTSLTRLTECIVDVMICIEHRTTRRSRSRVVSHRIEGVLLIYNLASEKTTLNMQLPHYNGLFKQLWTSWIK
jgi:hypothetical protein